MKRATPTYALLLALGTTTSAAAQLPDSLRTDSVALRNQLPALTIGVARLTATTGGASAVELLLDSMATLPAPTMEQVFRAMPLIVVRTNSRGQAQPSLRGSEDRQVAILMDGVPLTLGWDHRTDLSVVPLTAAQAVTLIRGLSTVLHGPNVLGGVVEVDVARGAQRQTEPDPLVLNVSGDHLGGRALAVTGGGLFDGARGQWVLRAGAGYQQRAGFAVPSDLKLDPTQRADFLTGGGELRLNSDIKRFDAFLSARYQKDNGSWFSLSNSAFTTERGVPPESHVDEPRLWRYPAQERLIVAMSAGTGSRVTGWGEGDLEASVGIDLGSTYIDRYETEAFRLISGGEVGDDRTLTLRLLGDHTLGNRTDFRTALTYADIAHDEELDGALFNRYRQRLWSLGTEVERRFGGFLGMPGLADTRVTVGMALDGSDTPESGDKPSLGTLWDWGARIGFSSIVREGEVRFHGGLSRRARFPALRELYSGALGRFVANPDLESEALTGVEVGLTWAPGSGEVQVVAFHQRTTDAIVRTTVEVDGIAKFKRVNRDEIRSTGLEVLANASLGRWAVAGDITLQSVQGFGEGGSKIDLEYEPSVIGKLNLGTTLPGKVIGSAGVRFTGAQLCENPEIGGLDSFETDPSLDLSFRRRFNGRRDGMLSRVEAVLAIDNLLDGPVFDQCGLPQPGRTFRLQLRLW